MRGNESIASVEDSVPRGKRDRDLDSAQTLSERANLHVYLEQKAESAVRGECAAQKRLSEAETDMEIRNSEMALYETNRELESHRLEFHHSNQYGDQAQREKRDEFTWRNGNDKQILPRNFQEISKKLRSCKNLLRRSRSSQTIEN